MVLEPQLTQQYADHLSAVSGQVCFNHEVSEIVQHETL